MMTIMTTTLRAPLAIRSIGSSLAPAAFAATQETARSSMEIMYVLILVSCSVWLNAAVSAGKRNITDGYPVVAFVDVPNCNVTLQKLCDIWASADLW